MSWTVVPLVRIACAVAASLALGACVDPHGDYDDFVARPVSEPMHDAAAPEVTLTACETLLQKIRPATTTSLACPPSSPRRSDWPFIRTSRSATGAKARVKTSFKMLDINGTNIKDLVGETFDAPAHVDQRQLHLRSGHRQSDDPRKGDHAGRRSQGRAREAARALANRGSRVRGARRTGHYSDPALAGCARRLLSLSSSFGRRHAAQDSDQRVRLRVAQRRAVTRGLARCSTRSCSSDTARSRTSPIYLPFSPTSAAAVPRRPSFCTR